MPLNTFYDFMKCLLLIIYFLFTASVIHSQEIETERISWGLSINYTVTEGDLNKHWGNFFSPGIHFQYDINENFLFDASVSASYLKPFTIYNDNEIPSITLINSLAGIECRFASTKNFVLSISPGLSNSTFIFSGKAANKVESNYIEHEFGFFISPAFGFNLSEKFSLEFFIIQQIIFSSPDYLHLTSSGLRFIIR